jgi:uncharacterized Zn finger protein
MVHYNPFLFLAQTLPPVCPKCGSHRTEIVGRSGDGATVVLRCNACGDRSSVNLSDGNRRDEKASQHTEGAGDRSAQ